MINVAPAGLLKAVCLSHTPLRGLLDPDESIVSEIDAVLARIRRKVEAFQPQLVILFAPDHFNGFFYDLMPPYCIGTEAEAIGDFGTPAGKLSVPAELAESCASFLMRAGLDVSLSHRMRVDHGFANPLHDLFGGLDCVPVIPIFINSVAAPLPPIARVRALGRAIGQFATTLSMRVLLVGSGGLSHEPPVPRLAGATKEVAERLIAGRNPSPEASQARLGRLMDAARRLTAQDKQVKALNPEWDRQFLEHARSGNWTEFEACDDNRITQEAGNSAHEVRTWLAALSGVEAVKEMRVQVEYYRPVPEWIAGFAVAWAEGSP
jgi:2,3-dihydroxyphenylpropionate 1,2-dioxygenase